MLFLFLMYLLISRTFSPGCLYFMLHVLNAMKISFLILTGLSFILPLFTHANSSEQEKLPETKLETTLVSSTRIAKDRSNLSSSFSVISNASLNEVSPIHIGEALQRVPGIIFNRGSGQESLLGLRSGVLTGAGSCGAVQVSQDGIPVRGAGFCNVNQLFDANAAQANSIEIIRGPSSILFGSNALQGAINTVSFDESNTSYTKVLFEAGPNDYFRSRLESHANKNKHHFALKLNGSSDGGYVEDSGFDQQKVQALHRYEGDRRITSVLSVTNLNQETAGYLVGTDAYRDDELRTLNFNPEAFRDTKSLRFHTKIEGGRDKQSWVVTPYIRSSDMTFLMHFLPGTPLEENGHDSIGVQSIFQTQFSDIAFQYGIDLEFSDGYLKQGQNSGFGPFPEGKHYDYEVSSLLLSPFILADYKLSNTKQIHVGIRGEHLEYDYDNRMISGNTDEFGVPCSTGACRYSRPEDRKDRFNNLSITFGYTQLINENAQVYSNASRTFRAPQTSELYRLQQNQSVSDLDSENVNSLEAGLRSTFGMIELETAVYYAKKKDLIFQDSDRNNISGAETAHRGIELTSTLTFTDKVQLSFAGSYAKHSYENAVIPRGVSESLEGNDMDTAPRLIVNANIRWEFIPKHQFNLEYLHVDEYFTDESNEHQYPGHDLWHLRYQYLAEKNWNFAARITNLTDTAYAERADFSSFTGDRYFVGQPRSIFLSIGYNFK